MRHIERNQTLAPVKARIRLAHQPVGMLPSELAALAHEERCRPYPRAAPRVADAAGQVGKRMCEARAALQPITYSGLVAIVKLDNAYVEAQAFDCRQVLQNIGLCHLSEVLIPRAPDRRQRLNRRDAKTRRQLISPLR